MACAAALTFFAGCVCIQRLGQVIHDRKIKTDATEIVDLWQSWKKKYGRAPEVLEAPRCLGVGVAICDAIPQPHCRIGKVGLRAVGGAAGKYTEVTSE
jgi:hypothetical protein